MEMEGCQLNRQVLNVKKSPVSLVRAVLVSEMQTKGLGSRVDHWCAERCRAGDNFTLLRSVPPLLI